eukprot:08924.XXX_209042_209242_1 [CDS] Oithona nana genome sequencing.
MEEKFQPIFSLHIIRHESTKWTFPTILSISLVQFSLLQVEIGFFWRYRRQTSKVRHINMIRPHKSS